MTMNIAMPLLRLKKIVIKLKEFPPERLKNTPEYYLYLTTYEDYFL